MEEGDEFPDSSSLDPNAAVGIEPSRKRGGGGPFLIQRSACTHSFSRQKIGVGKAGYAHPIACPSCKHRFRPSRATCSGCAMPALRCICRAIEENPTSDLLGIGSSSSSYLLPPSHLSFHPTPRLETMTPGTAAETPGDIAIGLAAALEGFGQMEGDDTVLVEHDDLTNFAKGEPSGTAVIEGDASDHISAFESDGGSGIPRL